MKMCWGQNETTASSTNEVDFQMILMVRNQMVIILMEQNNSSGYIELQQDHRTVRVLQ